MRIIRFTVRNHRSLRDEVSLELTSSKLRTNQPKDGESWSDYLHTLVGVFGPNASGKSDILNALDFMMRAIARSSSGEWKELDFFPQEPFQLDPELAQAPSFYELEFLLSGGGQYLYSFEASREKVLAESLSVLNPETSRWNRIFSRRGQEIKRGYDVGYLRNFTEKELVASKFSHSDSERFGSVPTDMLMGVDYITVDQKERVESLRALAQDLLGNFVSEEEIILLLRAADIRVTGVEAEEKIVGQENIKINIDNFYSEWFERGEGFAWQDNSGDSTLSEEFESSTWLEEVEIVDDIYEYDLLFKYGDSNGQILRLEEESDGTLAWLLIAYRVLVALREGNILFVDEIDRSLHPHLVQLLLELFVDPSINREGAQLIFTLHDATLLSEIWELGLAKEQIYLAEKGTAGETSLLPLTSFPRAASANYTKRYMDGRYGSVPLTSLTTFRKLIQDSEYSGSKDGKS